MEPIIREVEDYSWIFALVLAIGIAFVFVKYAFMNLFSSLDNPQGFKEGDNNAIPLAIFVNIMSAILIGIMLIPFLDLHYPLFYNNKWIKIGFIIALIVVFILFKFLVNTLINFYTNDKKDFINIVNGKIFYRIYWIIFLIICVLLLYFSDIPQIYILYAFLISLGTFLLIEYYQILNQGNLYMYMNSYYFILYLCILEIFPVLYIYNHWYR